MVVVALLLLAIIFALPILAIWALLRAASKWRERRRLDQEQAGKDQTWLSGYSDWTYFASPFDRSFIAISFDKETIDIGKVGDVKHFAFSSLHSAELVTSTTTATTTALRGPVSNARSMSVELLRRLTLKVLIEDASEPYFEILFFAVARGPRAQINAQCQEGQAQAEKFHGLLVTAIAKVKGGGAAPAAPAAPAKGGADELEKLWTLKQAGALTDSEFKAQKAKLLGDP
jgi:hypothetical protein